MTTRQTSIDEDDFQAFVDGQLPPERCRAVMAYLAAQTDESSRMSDYRTLSDGLHELYDEVLYEPLPSRLRVDHYRGRASWRDRLQRWFGFGVFGLTPRLVGLAALLAASGAGGWWMNSAETGAPMETPGMTFARQAANAHLLYVPDINHPVELGADQEENLLVWLSDRLGEKVHVPRLQDLGFALVGGRLLPAGGQPAAQLMYEDVATRAQRITLYIGSRWSGALNPAQSEGSVIYAAQDEVGLVYWIEGPFAYALTGQMDREQLFATAATVQQQLAMPELPVITPTPEQTATTEKDAT